MNEPMSEPFTSEQLQELIREVRCTDETSRDGSARDTILAEFVALRAERDEYKRKYELAVMPNTALDVLVKERDVLTAIVEAVNTDGLTMAVMNAVIERNQLQHQVVDLTYKLEEVTLRRTETIAMCEQLRSELVLKRAKKLQQERDARNREH